MGVNEGRKTDNRADSREFKTHSDTHMADWATQSYNQEAQKSLSLLLKLTDANHINLICIFLNC